MVTTTTTVVDHRSPSSYRRSSQELEIDSARSDLSKLAKRGQPSPAAVAIAQIETGQSTIYESSEDFLAALSDR